MNPAYFMWSFENKFSSIGINCDDEGSEDVKDLKKGEWKAPGYSNPVTKHS